MQKKNKTQMKQQRIPRILGLGTLSFDFTLTLTKDQLTQYNIDPEQIKTSKDLSTIVSNKPLWDKVQISSTNQLITTLLYINKTPVTKYFVELITFNKLNLSKDEEYLQEMISHVTEHNLLFLNDSQILGQSAKVQFVLKCEKNTLATVVIGEEGLGTQNKEEESIESLELFPKIQSEYKEFDYLMVDLGELLTIFDNASKLMKLQEYLKKVTSTFRNLRVVVRYPSIINNTSLVNLDFINVMTDILSYSDICLFEKKEALVFFNTLNHIQSDEANVTELDEKHLTSLFCKYAKCTRRSQSKICFFLCDFQSILVVEKSHNSLISEKEYEILLHPRINHTNQRLVDEYRRHIAVNNTLLTSIFYGGFFGRYVKQNTFYPAYAAGMEISKKILELIKNNLEIPQETEFYQIKLPKQKIEQEIQNEHKKFKETKFVLDCVNRNKSSLKFYNPLYDDHLNTYFGLGTVRKHLKENSFINTNGFVLFDPVYRTMMERSSSKGNIWKEKEKEKSLLNAIRKNTLRVVIYIMFRIVRLTTQNV